jgi:transposase
VAHEVTNEGHDRAQLAVMSKAAKAELGADELTVLADRGYYDGDEILACEAAGITPLVPRPDTSNAKAEGRFGKVDFVYEAATDTYRCPAGKVLTRRFTTVEDGKTQHVYSTSSCSGCALKPSCTTAKERRVRRWQHEAVLEAMQQRLDAMPDAMQIRRSTVEHPFGTLKRWMGQSHFLKQGLKNVSAEMSPHVLAYNLTRTIRFMGVGPPIAATKS